MKIKASVLLNITLTTTLLASILFSAFTEKTTSVEYDPWLDYNDDGTIDMKDIYATVRAYGSEGDPTKNVTVTNFPTKQPEPPFRVISIIENLNITWSCHSGYSHSEIFDLGSVAIAGYSRMSFYMRVTNYTRFKGAPDNYAYVSCRYDSIYEYGRKSLDSLTIQWDWNSGTQPLFHVYRGIEIHEPSVGIVVQGTSFFVSTVYTPTISCLVSIGIYLRNE